MSGMDFERIASNPVFFERNRVFRVYTGGKLFHEFFGDPARDNNLPEEWVASSVKAMNKNENDPHEGISRVAGESIYLDELMKAQKERMTGDLKSFDVLVKVLDSAIRLPVQAHPDKNFSRRYFHSEFGKTEAWLVLATREDAKLYFGFRDGVSEAEFIAAIEASEHDKSAMEKLLNEIPAKAGDLYLIPAGAAHAIGYGCLILEIQEPTDFTIQPEAWCGDYHLSEFEKYLGIAPEISLECFDYSISGECALRLGKKTPRVSYEDKALTKEQLIGSEDTSCFLLNRYRIRSEWKELTMPAIYIVTDGFGECKREGYSHSLQKGDYFFLPAAAGGTRIETAGGLELVECLPPR